MRAELTSAQRAMTSMVRKLQSNFESSSDFTQALTKVSTSKAAYTAASSPVLAAMKTRDDYQAAQTAVDQARSQQTNTDTTDSERAAAARNLIEARNSLSKIQNGALADDSKAAAARGTLDAATAEVASLRRQFEESMKQDTQWTSAKQAVDDAKAKVAAADQALAAAKTDLAKQKEDRAAALAARAKSNQANASPKPAN